ncbi:DnaJ domain-containing protein [Pseudomonas aeruginosa]|uniref:DnaJ domain-containing protein n=1 Tax=Pseudomonas aeruginosa TaxID=287 RepID=UPI000F549EDE|nr:DnaJ domain-containing protein [Pseudomonas aeruginosa]RQF81504.1 hypothetical protein IPC258_02295 [Pseudomonas aeruginosa]
MRTHYDNLHVSESASPEVIRAAYKALAQKWHPDKNSNRQEESERYFKVISQSFEVLSDSEKRAAYDAWLKQQRANSVLGEAVIKEGEAAAGPVRNVPNVEFEAGFHPWRRYFARLIDVCVFVLIGFVFFLVIIKNENLPLLTFLFSNVFLLFASSFVFVVVVEVLFLLVWGNTVGKALMGVKIESSDGGSIEPLQVVKRSVLVNLLGQGAHIPSLSGLLNMVSYFHLRNSGLSYWDRVSGTNVLCKSLSVKQWVFSVLIVVVLLVSTNAIFTIFEVRYRQSIEALKEHGASAVDKSTYSSVASSVHSTMHGGTHYDSIYAAHPDADYIFESDLFRGWVALAPERGRVLESGNVSEVISLFNEYKMYLGSGSLKVESSQENISPPSNAEDAVCQFKPVMTDDDYKACGLRPPGVYPR